MTGFPKITMQLPNAGILPAPKQQQRSQLQLPQGRVAQRKQVAINCPKGRYNLAQGSALGFENKQQQAALKGQHKYRLMVDPVRVLTIIAPGVGSEATKTRGNGYKTFTTLLGLNIEQSPRRGRKRIGPNN